MNAVVPFAFEDSLVRAVWHNDDPWFVGLDVCRSLGIKKHHQALNRLDEDERGTCRVGTPGGEQEMIAVSEPGVWRLVFGSTAPAAERFKRWLAHEVLPTLRRTGRFAMPGAPAPEGALDAEMRLREWHKEMIAEARRNFGKAAARALWVEFGYTDLSRSLPAEAQAVDLDALSEAVAAFAQASGRWTGTAVQLLAALNAEVGPETRRHPNWPRTGQGLGSRLIGAEIALAARGVALIRSRTKAARTLTLVAAGAA